jgi:hypothetical protein
VVPLRALAGAAVDGSHEGTGIEPLEWKVERNRRAYLCTCKRTKTPPLCDGSHKTLPAVDA